MAWSLVAHTSAIGAASPVTTGGINTTGADLIVVLVTGYAPDLFGAASVTDSKSNTWTPLTEQGTVVPNTTAYGQLFYCHSPIVGTGHTFSANGSGDVFGVVAVQAWSGSAASSPFDQQNGSVSTVAATTIQPGSITPGSNGELIIAGVCFANDGGSSTYTINDSFTVSDFNPYSGSIPAEGGGLAYLVQTTAAAINPTWTDSTSSAEQAAAIASFKGAGGTQHNQAANATNSSVASLARSTGLPLKATDSAIASLAKKAAKAFVAVNSAVAIITKSTRLPVSAANAAIAAVTKSAGKVLAATSAAIASLTALKVHLQAALATNSAVASLSRQVGAVRLATDSAVASVVRASRVPLTTVNSAAALIAKRTNRALIASDSAAALLLRRTGKILAVTGDVLGSLVAIRATQVTLLAVNAAAALVTRSAAPVRLASSAAVASLSRSIGITRVASDAPIALVARLTSKAIAATNQSAALVARAVAVFFQALNSALASAVGVHHGSVTLDPTRAFMSLAPRLRYVGQAAPLQYVSSAPRLRYVAKVPPDWRNGMQVISGPSLDAGIPQTIGIDFGFFLPAGVTLVGTPSIVVSVAAIGGVDVAPQSRLTEAAQIATVPIAQGGSGLADVAILGQLTLLGGVTYLVWFTCGRSDGTDQVSAWRHYTGVTPN